MSSLTGGMAAASLAALLAFLACPFCLSATPDEAWEAVVALDAGPKQKPGSREEVAFLARNHFALQRKTIEDFLARYPSDDRASLARLRLAEISAAEGAMDEDSRKIRQAIAAMGTVESDASAPPEVRADAAFRRASILMQTAPGGPRAGYKQVVAAAKQFVANHPDDPRGPRLLVEAATVCDAHPGLKRELLDRAAASTGEEALRRRIADDRKRLDLLDAPLELRLPGLNGGTFDVTDLRGKPVILVFWSSDAPQSLLWLRDLRAAWPEIQARGIAVATVNLDTDKSAARARAAAMDAPWPVGREDGGWQSPTARQLGINALPTVFVLDREGIVRTIDARDNAVSLATSLAE